MSGGRGSGFAFAGGATDGMGWGGFDGGEGWLGGVGLEAGVFG